MRMKLTRQGVRDLNGPPKNQRERPETVTCFHEFDHDRECVGCWAENFGGYSLGQATHDEICRRCGKVRSF
jgi:hypothetical protein